MADGEPKKAYISYSRRGPDAHQFMEKLIAEAQHGATTLRTLCPVGSQLPVQEVSACLSKSESCDWEVIYDGILKPDDSISLFMEKLAEGERIVFFLSQGYFQSRFCLYELWAAYNKQAEHLLPVVVFAQGFCPGDSLAPDTRALLEHHAKEASTPRAKKRYRDMIDDLPNALTWLLGARDNNLEYYQKLFIQENDQNAAAKTIEALNTSMRLRFSLPSRRKRINTIQENIEKIIDVPQLADDWRTLERACSVPGNSTLAEFFCWFIDPDELHERIKKFVRWLKDSVASKQNTSGFFADQVKQLFAQLLLLTVDEKQLRKHVLGLNHGKDDAHLCLAEENSSAFQIVASAIGKKTIRYRLFEGQKEKRLCGEGELCLVERGFSEKNLYEYMGKEGWWNTIIIELYKQMHTSLKGYRAGGREHLDDYSGGIKGLLDGSESEPYLVMDAKKNMTTGSVAEFRKQLHNGFPEILQIIGDNTAERVQSILLPGLNVARLHENIKDVYESIEKMIGTTNRS